MKKQLSKLNHWKTAHRAIPLMLFLFLACSFVSAQTKVSGTVSDENGLTLPGANVLVVGTATSTTSDINGRYEISVPSDGSLSFSFIGFVTQKISVKGKISIDVKLASTAENLKDVVVIGYGTQKRKDVNSAISSISSKDIENLKVVSFDQMMQGKAAGVVVSNNSGEPGGNVSVKIRGASSLTGTNEPLYVIDGVPISGDARNSSTSGRNASGNSNFSNSGNITYSPLSLINPNDIESIDILKDASATAIYGSRGANGVVLVTTKSGKRGTGKLTYENTYSFSDLPKQLPSMNLQQYASHQNALSKVYGIGLRPEFAHPEFLGAGTDWQKEIYQTGIMTSNQLSFSGGKDGVNYYISGGILNQEGIVIESGFKRYNFRSNIDAKVNKFIKVGANISGTITDEKLTLNGQFNGVVATSLLATPDVGVRDLSGAFSGPTQGLSFVNPVATSLLGSNTLVRKNYSGNFYTQIDLFKGLEYRFEAGGYIYDNLGQNYDPMYSLGNAVKNYANLYYNPSSGNSWNLKNMLTYRNTIGKHNFTVLAVQESNRAHWEGYSINATGFKDNSHHELAYSDLSQAIVSSPYEGVQTLSSYLGRVVYDYGDKYGISGAVRTDGSSKFDVGKKWGVFGSFGASWKLSNEAFMESTKKYVDNIKFRFGWGQTGNNQIPNNLYDSNLHLVNSSMGNSYLPSNTNNANLKWETQEQTNLGLDFTLFKSEFSASVDVYNKVSKNFLYQVPLPNYLSGGGDYEGGVNPPYFNLGSMRNKGIEVTLGYSHNFTENFSWNANLNLSKYINEVTDMAGLNIVKTTNTLAYSTVSVTRTMEGLPIGSFVGYQAAGIYRTDDDLLTYGHTTSNGSTKVPLKNGTNSLLPNFVKGDVIYKDQNNDGIIDSKDLVTIGNPNPKLTYGFTNNFKYKNVDLSIFLQGTAGNKLMNLTRAAGTMNNGVGTNYLTEAADFYSATNLDAAFPRPSAYDDINNAVSSRFIEDGSYLRIQNVTLGYSLPSDLISKIKLSRLRIYAAAQNLYTFTEFTGYDPEVGSYNQDALLSGIDNGRYPTPRQISLGLNVEF